MSISSISSSTNKVIHIKKGTAKYAKVSSTPQKCLDLDSISCAVDLEWYPPGYNKNTGPKSNGPRTFNANSVSLSSDKGGSLSFTNEQMIKMMNLINEAHSGNVQANMQGKCKVRGQPDLRRSSRVPKVPAKFNDYVVNSSKKYGLEKYAPDIAYVVHCLSQYMHSPLNSHLDAALRVLRYLKASPGSGIQINKTGNLKLRAYADFRLKLDSFN
ncbi:hypothetical protein Tco_0269924 [Tanacetum coccineum]